MAVAPWLGAASDLGRRHHLNQDALSLAATDEPHGAVIAVSDGVTTAPASDVAAVLATSTACAELQQRLAEVDVSTALIHAFQEAHHAVLCGAPDSACTLVVAVLQDGYLSIGSVGDSRAYWIPDDGEPQLLSVDDSVAQARIGFGMDRAVAEASSHAITRWLGRDTSDVRPNLQAHHPDGHGLLVVCSDGLWNYASEPAALAAAVRSASAGCTSAAATASALVEWANEQGGRDNITVAVLRVE